MTRFTDDEEGDYRYHIWADDQFEKKQERLRTMHQDDPQFDTAEDNEE